MYAPRLSFIIVSTLACLPTAIQAQGPWPTMSQPTFFSPVHEFFTPRSYSTYYPQPSYSQYPSTSIIPGVPQCANGQCPQSCPNGQCSPRSRCANGQCSNPSQTYYQPQGISSGSCANGSCRPNTGCVNGQCGPRPGNFGGNGGFFNGTGNYGTLRPGAPNSSIGFRSLTPVQPNYNAPSRGGQLNRLVPLDGGFQGNGGYNAPQAPMYRDRESMVPQSENYANDPTVRFQ